MRHFILNTAVNQSRYAEQARYASRRCNLHAEFFNSVDLILQHILLNNTTIIKLNNTNAVVVKVKEQANYITQ